jgi:DnaK suppressor protein
MASILHSDKYALDIWFQFLSVQGTRSMKKKDRDYFEKLLNEQLTALLDSAEHTVHGLVETNDHMADPLDRASFESHRSTLLRIRDRESYLIRKIKKALENLEDGTFGVCEICDEVRFAMKKSTSNVSRLDRLRPIASNVKPKWRE